MFNKKGKINLDNLFDDSNILHNYSSTLNTEPHNYYSAISPYEINNYNTTVNDNAINELYSDYYNQNKVHDYLKYINNYPSQIRNSKNNYNKYNKSTFSNSIKDLRQWDKGLSRLTLNKFKQMKGNINDDIKKHQTIQNDVDLFQKQLLINYSNSNSTDSIKNNINKSDEFYINENLDDNDNNSDDEDNLDIIKLNKY